MSLGAFRLNTLAKAAAVASFTDTYYFGATVGNGSDNNNFIATDADSNMYGIMQTDSSTLIGNRDIYVWKRNSEGTFQWARRLGFSERSWTSSGIAADSSGNVYCVMNDPSNYNSLLFKLDNTGSISLVKRIKGDDASYFTSGLSRGQTTIAVTDSKVHIIGYSGNSTYKTNIVTLNSSNLTHSWSRQITPGGDTLNFGEVRADSSGNVYAMFGGGTNSHIVKYNSSGTIQWQKNIDYTDQDAVGNLAVDSTGAVYVTGNYNSGLWFAKVASDGGSVSWTKTITNSDVVASQPQIQVDNNDNVYVAARTAGNAATFIAKFNSSGTLDWRRTITPAQSNMVNLGSAINNYAFYVIAGHNFSDTRDSVVMKIPLDGTLTATKSLNSENFVYASNTSIAIATTPAASVSTSSLSTDSTDGSSTNFTDYSTNTTSLTNYLVTL